MSAWSVSGENSLSGLQTAALVLTWEREREGGFKLSGVSFYKDTTPIVSGSQLPHLTFYYFLRCPISRYSHAGG